MDTQAPIFKKKISLKLSENQFDILEILFPEKYLNCSISDASLLKNLLRGYFFTLSVIAEGINKFLSHEYRLFDALIGNNSCYATAYIIFNISHQYKNASRKHQIKNLLESLDETKKLIQEKLNAIENYDYKPQGNFKDFIIINNLIPECNDMCLLYVGLSYACTISKSQNEEHFEEINYDNLWDLYQKRLNLPLARKSVIKLVRHWQKILSHHNIAFIQRESEKLEGEFRTWAKYLKDPYIIKDERERLCASSLYSIMTIYGLLLLIPNAIIGLQVNLVDQYYGFLTRFTIFFKTFDSATFIAIPEENLSPTDSVYLFSGCRYLQLSSRNELDIEVLKTEFGNRNLLEIILAHEVTYPQYPKATKQSNIIPIEKTIVEKIEQHKLYQGFSLEDPSDLCLVHIYVDNVMAQKNSVSEPPVLLPQINLMI